MVPTWVKPEREGIVPERELSSRALWASLGFMPAKQANKSILTER